MLSNTSTISIKTKNSKENEIKYKSEENQTKMISFLMNVLCSNGYSFLVKKPTKTNCKRMSILPILEIHDYFGTIVFSENIVKEDMNIQSVCETKKESLRNRIKSKYSRIKCVECMLETLQSWGVEIIYGVAKKASLVNTSQGYVQLPSYPRLDAIIMDGIMYNKEAILSYGEQYYNALIESVKHLKRGEVFIVSNVTFL